MPTSDCSILKCIKIYHGNQCSHTLWMGSNENCGRNSTLKFPAASCAYGPVLGKISKCHIFFSFWQITPKKVIACMIKIPSIKFG